VNAMLRLVEDSWGQDNPAFRQLLTTLMWPGANAEQAASFNQLQRVSCSPQTAVALMQAIANFDATEDLASVQCPALVLHSPRDSRVSFEESRLLASMIKGARLEPFDSPNHTPLVGEPAFEQVQRLIEAFLLDEHHPREQTKLQAVERPPLHVVDNKRASVLELKAKRNRP
jgi:pimeloyl-ACP methyl ester carboxylesterase